jgi:DNA-binding MarR family transcriptional regulator
MSKQHYHFATYKAQGSIGYLVKRSHSLMLDMLEPVLEQHGFSFVQYVILSWLRDGIAVNPRDICAQYRHDSGAMTRVVDQLCERGLVERARRGLDRRKVELQLTASGKEAIENLIPLVIEKLNAALGDFTTHEFEELQRLLIKMNTKLQATVEPGAGLPGAGQPGTGQAAAVAAEV